MEADWVARGIAIGGATIGALSLGWNIFSWKRQGPVIKVRASCTGRGAEMKISGSVRNMGRFDAQIASAWFAWSPSSQSQGSIRPVSLSIYVPSQNLDGLSFPLPLEAQSGAEFTVSGVAELDPGLSLALHDRRQVIFGVRTATQKNAKRRIRYR